MPASSSCGSAARRSPRPRLLYEGKRDVLVAPPTFHTKEGNFGLVIRAVSFFESEYFAVESGKARKLPLPLSADVKGMFDGA